MTPHRHLLTVLVGLSLGASLLTGCGLSGIVSRPGPKTDGPQVRVLFDSSDSTRPDRGLYLAQFKALVAQLAKRHGTIRGAVLSGNSLATAEWKIDKQFASPPDTNPYQTSLALDRRAREVNSQAAELLAHSESGTDILGAMQFIARDWTGPHRALAVLSDGMQYTSELNLDPRTLSPPAIPRIVRRLKAEGALPSLAGTDVYWVGGGLHAHLDRQQLQNLQRFWTTYVAQAGGRMVSWDAALGELH